MEKKYGKIVIKAVSSAAEFLDRKAVVYQKNGIYTAVFFTRISGKFQRVGITRASTSEAALKFFGFTPENIIS